MERLTLCNLPPRFIQDCEECGCEVGEYDARARCWTGTLGELSELQSRAHHYASGGTDAAPAGLKGAAKALLKAIDREVAELCAEADQQMLDNAY